MAKKKTGRDTDADYETEAEVDAAEDAERDEVEAKAEDRGAVVSDQVEAIQHDAVTVPRQVAGQAYAGQATLELLETTDVEDIQALSDALVEVIQGSAYDDMTWNEIDHALRRTSHAIRQNWAATGSVKPAEPAPPEDPLRSAEAPARAAEAKDEKPRYAG